MTIEVVYLVVNALRRRAHRRSSERSSAHVEYGAVHVTRNQLHAYGKEAQGSEAEDEDGRQEAPPLTSLARITTVR